VLHYGRVPPFAPAAWDLRVFGGTADGSERRWTWAEVEALPRVELEADFHCVTKFSVLGNTWRGISPQVVLDRVPPAAGVTHVMVWAEYGYSANLSLADFGAGLFATHRNGEPLTPDHGAPMRLVVPQLYAWKGPKWVRGVEYLTGDRRGFWEERGYHNRADPWLEQRYSYQESAGDGPGS
jgi:DMSO/TMAO reductase YedYZ molybdopterin-dependent catalytic subunit